jgi:signal transduction histidine kinase/CheY-like chemotaxis protein
MTDGAVLLVEDDIELAAALGEFLEHEGRSVVVATTGEKALAHLREQATTLVLLDLQLPDVDGVVIMEHARRQPAPADVIILTGHASLESAIAAVAAGAAAYLVKPIALAQLAQLVRSVTDQRRLREDHARLQAEQVRRSEEAERLLLFGRSLSAVTALRPTLGEAARQAAQVLGASRCAIHLAVDGELRPVMAQFADGRIDTDRWARCQTQGTATSLTAYPDVVRTRREVAIADGRQSSRIPQAAAAALELGALLIVPLINKDEVIGTLTVETSAPHAWTVPETTLAMTIAGQVALAISNAQLYEETETQRMALAQIFESTTDGVMLLARDGRIAWANNRAGTLLAFRPDSVVGVALTDLLAAHCTTADDYRRLVEPFSALLGDEPTGREGDLELPRLRTTLHWTAQPTVNRAGTAVGLTLTWLDVTEQREVSRMKSDFVSFVSHQLRTPLAGIKWLLEFTTQPGVTPDEMREYIEDARTSAERLISLVNDLLDISRLERGKLTLTHAAVSLPELTASVLADVDRLVQQKGHRVQVQPGEGIPPAWADAQLLRQVILNLVSNAVKYTPAGGAIDIRIEPADTMIRWSVRDTGIGIPPAAQQRLFEKFYRAENAATLETEGTGLGLYLVRLIVECLGGRVWCESVEGVGSTFSVTVPVAATPSTGLIVR